VIFGSQAIPATENEFQPETITAVIRLIRFKFLDEPVVHFPKA
jgi:hypothetical protein